LDELPSEAAPPEWVVLLRSRRQKPFEIVATEAPAPAIRVTSAQKSPGQYILHIANLRATRDIDGKAVRVRVKKPDGEEDTIEIPIRVKAREKR